MNLWSQKKYFKKFFTAEFIAKTSPKIFTVNFIEKKIRHFFQKIEKKTIVTTQQKRSHRVPRTDSFQYQL